MNKNVKIEGEHLSRWSQTRTFLICWALHPRGTHSWTASSQSSAICQSAWDARIHGVWLWGIYTKSGWGNGINLFIVYILLHQFPVRFCLSQERFRVRLSWRSATLEETGLTLWGRWSFTCVFEMVKARNSPPARTSWLCLATTSNH